MKRINIASPGVGKISPPYQAANFDRPAHYEHKGEFYDAHGRHIEPGVPLPPEDADPAVGADEDVYEPDYTLPAASLLGQINTMPWGKFRAAAEKLLGDDCPRSKAQIEAKLKALVKGQKLRSVTVDREVAAIGSQAAADPLASRKAKAAAARADAPSGKDDGKTDGAVPKGGSKGGRAGKAGNAGNAGAGAAVNAAGTGAAAPGPGIDLAAWARGENEYLAGDLVKAAKAQHGIDATERGAILEALIEKGVVEADEARQEL